MTTSPSIAYARIFGIVLVLAGILGLFVTTDQDTAKSLLGFDVNLTHNFVHLATGLLGLVAGFALLSWARAYALVFGVIYLALGLWGLFSSGTFDPFGIFVQINTADNWLHIAIGVLGIGAYIASREQIDAPVAQ